MRRLLLCLRLLILRLTVSATAAATASPSSLPLCRGRRFLGRLLLSLPVLILLLLLALLLFPLLRLRWATAFTLPLIAVTPACAATAPLATFGRAGTFRSLFGARSGPLLPLAEFLLHEPAAVRLQLLRTFAEPAVGTAFPSLGVGLAALRADDALR